MAVWTDACVRSLLRTISCDGSVFCSRLPKLPVGFKISPRQLDEHIIRVRESKKPETALVTTNVVSAPAASELPISPMMANIDAGSSFGSFILDVVEHIRPSLFCFTFPIFVLSFQDLLDGHHAKCCEEIRFHADQATGRPVR